MTKDRVTFFLLCGAATLASVCALSDVGEFLAGRTNGVLDFLSVLGFAAALLATLLSFYIFFQLFRSDLSLRRRGAALLFFIAFIAGWVVFWPRRDPSGRFHAGFDRWALNNVHPNVPDLRQMLASPGLRSLSVAPTTQAATASTSLWDELTVDSLPGFAIVPSTMWSPSIRALHPDCVYVGGDYHQVLLMWRPEQLGKQRYVVCAPVGSAAVIPDLDRVEWDRVSPSVAAGLSSERP